MAVDYTPTLGDYKELKPFRYWCQKVLPLVYDESLSYYELLCKVVDYLNKTMEDVDTLHEDVDGLHDAYVQLQSYVNNYFDNLDVQEEINNKLDTMAIDGTLSAIIQPLIPEAVGDWLEEHLTPTTPAIDNTLTVSGAGADAKVTGDLFKQALLNKSVSYDYTDANDINTNCILFNSSTQGVPTLSHTPIYAGWIQTIITSSLATQIYYPYDSNLYNRPISIRQKVSDTWMDWHDLAYKDVTQNALANVSSGNANDLTDSCYVFINAPNTVLNLPTTHPGVLSVMDFDNITFQSFTDYILHCEFIRFRLDESWQSWYSGSLIDFKDTILYDNANNIPTTCIVFNSITSGSTAISNTPNYAGWLQTIITTSSLATQIYYPYESNLYNRPISIRQKVSGTWMDWHDIAYKDVTQNALATISSGNANDLTDSCYVFINSGNTVLNLPTTHAGVLSVMDFDTVTFQSFTDYILHCEFIRFRLNESWQSWYSGSLIDCKDTILYDNANNIPTTCIVFNSISSGSTAISNTPNYAGWLITYYTSNSLISQLYLPLQLSNSIKYRAKFGSSESSWSTWSVIGESYVKNITENTISNTYEITTSPTITTDTNGWLAPVDTESADESGKTDMTGAIMSMLNSTGYCHLADGIYYVSGSIDMPAGSTLEGCGKQTKIKLLNSVTNGYVVRVHTYSTIKNLCLAGASSEIDITGDTIGGRYGIYFIGNADGENPDVTPNRTIGCVVENCLVQGFNGYGFYGHNTGGNFKNGIIISDSHFYNCMVGISFGYRCEYNKACSSIISNCHTAIINNGGNNTFDSCNIHGIIGMLLDNSSDDMPNNSHGTCVNCVFNHMGSDISSTGYGVKAMKMSNGFIFNSCQFWYSKIMLTDCTGFSFNSCLFGGSGIDISATVKPVFLMSSIFASTPTISIPPGSKIVNCYNTIGNVIS